MHCYNSVLKVFELPMWSIKAIDVGLNSEFKFKL